MVPRYAAGGTGAMGPSPQRAASSVTVDRCIIGDSGPKSPVQARARRTGYVLRQPQRGSRYRYAPPPENAYVVQIRARRGRGCAGDGVGLRGIAGARTAHPARTSRIGAQLARVGAPGIRRLVGSRVGGDRTGATGQPVVIKGKGRLTYDAYGNLTVDARFDEGQEQADGSIAKLLSYKGRAVIDVAASRLVLQDMEKRIRVGRGRSRGDVGGQRPLLLVRRRSADLDDQGCRRQDDREDGMATDQRRQSRGDGQRIRPCRIDTGTAGACSRCDLGPIGAIRAEL